MCFSRTGSTFTQISSQRRASWTDRTQQLVPVEFIAHKIYLIRAQKVMLDSDLAELYGIETKQLKRAVKRNIDRFPSDFMFMVSASEYDFLRCQFGTLNRGAHSK